MLDPERHQTPRQLLTNLKHVSRRSRPGSAGLLATPHVETEEEAALRLRGGELTGDVRLAIALSAPKLVGRGEGSRAFSVALRVRRAR